jgi:hypothetical protein
VVNSRSQVETCVAREAKRVWWVVRERDQVVRISSRDLFARRDVAAGAGGC